MYIYLDLYERGSCYLASVRTPSDIHVHIDT
jgi:hypothetical protein